MTMLKQYVAHKIKPDGSLDHDTVNVRSVAYLTPQLAAKETAVWARELGWQRWAIVEIVRVPAVGRNEVVYETIATTILAYQGASTDPHYNYVLTPNEEQARSAERIANLEQAAAVASLRAVQIQSAIQRRELDVKDE